ncbi:hypothetical protein Bca101_017306 [Brassica carinata]
MTTSIPEDIIIDILARVPRCNYPRLSLVCKHFRSLVASPTLYAIRSFLGCTELCLYVLLHNRETGGDHGWSILRQKTKDNPRLVRIPSLPVAQHYAAMGSKIYVFDETKDDGVTTNVLSIDCRSHTVQPLPSIDVSVYTTVADIINGKIYVLGYHDTNSKKPVVVLNTETETETWEPVMTMPETMVHYTFPPSVVMMDGKMYMICPDGSYVYDPKESRCGTDEKLNFWVNGCVLDDVLYCYDFHVNSLRTYDPKQRRWGVVKGVEQLLAETKSCSPFAWTEIVGYGRKLVLFFSKEEVTREIWCAEISLERQKDEEGIWGKVEWCVRVMVAGNFVGSKCVAVMV